MNANQQARKPERLEAGQPGASRDNKLQNARRIDWRFLLPNPHLGRVGYWGPSHGGLATVLNQFSDSLTLIAPPYQPTQAADANVNFEQVVLHSSNLADLNKASTLLMPGGYLYWEIDRTVRFRSLSQLIKRKERLAASGDSNWKAHWGPPHFRDYVSAVAQLGFCDIQVSWHRPNFETCLEIIPLDDPVALNYVFSRSASNLASQAQLLAGRYLMKARLFARLVPCFSIVASKDLRWG